MTDITYEKVATAAPASASAPKATRKSFWRRFFEAVYEARMRQAEQVVREYQDLASRR